MNYDEAIAYIHSMSWSGTGSGIERTKELLELLRRPEEGLKVIHIAGTNGKGSVAAMLDSILRAAGYRTGRYTSPYIVRYNERMAVNGQDIPDELLAQLVTEVSTVVTSMSSPPNEFEFGTALALYYFAKQGCDYVILETGLGGRYDPTNIMDHPYLAIITAIGLDHTAVLGKSIREIALAKAGIIKEGVPVVFYGDNNEALSVIEGEAKAKHAPLFVPDFDHIRVRNGGSFVTVDDALPSFLQQIDYEQWKNLSLSLPGVYQQRNCALVLQSVAVLRQVGVTIPDTAVREGLSTVTWQARLEVLQNHPLFLADGSHNPQGMKATIESLMTYFKEKRFVFVFGVMADKELSPMLSTMLPHAKKVFVTAPSMPRAMKPELLMQRMKEAVSMETRLVLCETVCEAVQAAKKEPADEVVVIIGSLFLVGEVKRLFFTSK